MAIRVTHPSGTVVEFPDGTDSATIQKAMRQIDGGSLAQSGAVDSKPNMLPSAGETAGDVAKSLGAGLVRGVTGIMGFPGTVESLGRAGINKVAQLSGAQENVVDPDPMFKTASEVTGAVEDIAGPLYAPQSKAGEYARTVGEFAPAALFPGSAAARTMNVAAPAVVSETAGQMTKGTSAEPWARAAGALAGGSVPMLAARAVTPLPATAARTAAVNRLRNEGITDLTAGQATGSKALRWAESAAADVPFSGARASQMMDRQGEQFTRAALQRVGIDADRVTPAAIDDAFTQLGQHFDNIAQNTGVVVDQRLMDDLQNAVAEYQSIVPPTQQAPVVAGIVDDIMRTVQQNPNAAGMAGVLFGPLRSRISRLSAARHQDPQLSQALVGIREALDDALVRTNPQVAEQWQNLRQQYANLLRVSKAMEGAGEATASGLISPAQLRTAAKNANRRDYVRGRSDLGNLARDGEAIMKPLPNSGTPARQAVMNVGNVLAAVAGNSAGGPLGALGAVATPSLLARGLMSAPMQTYLGNQRLAPLAAALMEMRAPASAYLPQAGMYLSGEQDVGADTPEELKRKRR